MRKLTWFAAVAVAALVAAGVAVAHGKRHGDGIEAVSAHFTATPSEKTRTRTCTDPGDGGHVWHLTRGVYTGTATGDLAGAIVIRTQSTIDTTSGLGFTTGKVELRDPSTHKLVATARLEAVNTHNGILDGLLHGRTHEGMLLANFSAAFTADGSSLSGDVGSQSAGRNSAVVFEGVPRCGHEDRGRHDH